MAQLTSFDVEEKNSNHQSGTMTTCTNPQLIRVVLSQFEKIIESNNDNNEAELRHILEKIDKLTFKNKQFVSIIKNKINENKCNEVDIFGALLSIVENNKNKYNYTICGMALKSLLNIYKYNEKLIKYDKICDVEY